MIGSGRKISAPCGNAVKDFGSRIRQNLDAFESNPNSGEFGYEPQNSRSEILNGVR
jgi:hypothetical protein